MEVYFTSDTIGICAPGGPQRELGGRADEKRLATDGRQTARFEAFCVIVQGVPGRVCPFFSPSTGSIMPGTGGSGRGVCWGASESKWERVFSHELTQSVRY